MPNPNPATLTLEGQIEKAAKMGTASAKETYIHRIGFKLLRYSIRDNPFNVEDTIDKRTTRKLHVAWHNAFYAQRKLMERPIM